MEQRARRAPYRELTGRGLACALVIWACASCTIIHVSADTTDAPTPITLTPNTDSSTPSEALKSKAVTSGSFVMTSSEPTSSPPETPNPANLATTVSVQSTIIPTMSSPDSATIARLNATQRSATTLSTTSSKFATTIGPLKTTVTPLNTTPTPLNTTTALLNTITTPLNTTSAPLNTITTPLNTTSAPLNTTATPLNTNTAPLNTTTTPLNTATTAPNTTTNSSSSKTVTPVKYVIPTSITWNPATTSGTTHVATTQRVGQTNSPVSGSTSGSANSLTTAPPTVTSNEFETSVVVVVLETVVVKITDGEKTVEYVTTNETETIGGGPGLDPDREKDELKKLLFIIGGSIGGAVVSICVIFVIVYRVAKRRKLRANSRYYNFKKKRSNYEKVLHLQEYYGEVDTDTSAGTVASWVFQENEGEASKAITLELDPRDKVKPTGRSGRRHKMSQNKNKNNRNKSGAGGGGGGGGGSRGNYQVLAEMFPTRNIPPDVLLSADGAMHSNSEDDVEEGAFVVDTCFGPSLVAVSPPPDDRSSDFGSSVGNSDGLSSKGSFNSGGKSSWPAWNNRPYFAIGPEDDTVVEL